MFLKDSLIVSDFGDVIDYYSEDNACDMWSGPGEWNLCWHRGLRDHDWEYGSKLGRATGSSQPPKSSLINSHNVIFKGFRTLMNFSHLQLLRGHDRLPGQHCKGRDRTCSWCLLADWERVSSSYVEWCAKVRKCTRPTCLSTSSTWRDENRMCSGARCTQPPSTREQT